MVCYRIKENKYEELKGGMTLKYIADTLGISNAYIIGAFNGKHAIKKPIAASLVSFKERVYIGSKECEDFLDYYFTREEENVDE